MRLPAAMLPGLRAFQTVLYPEFPPPLPFRAAFCSHTCPMLIMSLPPGFLRLFIVLFNADLYHGVSTAFPLPPPVMDTGHGHI